MSTSFYGSLPESTTSENAKSVPIPITSTVTRTYVEYTSSPEKSSLETSAKQFIKYLDEADLDFEKNFKQQSSTVTTVTSQNIHSSTVSSEASKLVTADTKESTSTTTTTESTSKSDEKPWDKPLGKIKIIRLTNRC